MGGTSSERDVSLKSGSAVFQALKRRGYDVVTLDAAEDLPVLLRRRGVEAAYVCLHGPSGEDGTIQGFLEIMGIPYTGSGVLASAVAMDKILTKELLRYHGIPTPEFRIAESDRVPGAGLRLPVVVKPAEEGSTIGVHKVHRRKDLAPAIRAAQRYSRRVLVERFIAGREVTVGVLGDAPLPVVEVRPCGGFYDYAAKYTAGQTEYLVPAPLPKRVTARVQRLGGTVHRLLGCRGATRVDVMLAERYQPFVLEVNTIPGMTETSLLPKAAREAGISFDELVERILKMALADRAPAVSRT
jgi:D-alanine-D-alanine ligase